ncbi:hypothetical protein CRM22_003081 [Opisthorchis felineus]|uniref:Macro domain-containing protein n=1 Tax=Opisthorchis felineus TaxID=147828 RepID=A0A4S2M2Y2_OPIFE|nr:hypothetical protein CRM22_003081 [Opisthorchis felineus]
MQTCTLTMAVSSIPSGSFSVPLLANRHNTMTRSKAERSGLTFPVARIWRYMKRHYSFRRRRISITASVYLTAVMEYLTREVTELAGDLTIKAKRKLLTPRNIMLAIANDEELQKGFSSIVLPFSGVVPRFNKAMLAGKPSTSRPSPQRSLSKTNMGKTKRTNSSNAPKHSAAPVSVLSQRVIAKRTTLCVVRGSVTNARGDAVVHPTANSMSFSGQVGNALLRVGGQGLASIAQESYDQHGPLELDGVRLTRAVGLGCPYVLHCNSPNYNGSDTHQSVVRLTRVIEKCLEICDANNLRELVLPSVGSGGCHYPKQLAAETILRAIKTYCDAHFETTILTAIYFVLYDQESISVYAAELARLV